MSLAVSVLFLVLFVVLSLIFFIYPEVSEITDEIFSEITDCDYSAAVAEYLQRIKNVFS